MSKLSNSLRDWNSDLFPITLKQEIENLEAGTLPLMMGVSHGGIPDDKTVSVSVLKVQDHQTCIQADVGVFFTEILAGCSCGDEPMAMHGYCEMQVRVDKTTADTVFEVMTE
ncbi:MAG: glucosamine--fructose-6-phosphate aminotransferase [Pseudomonadota bacterium]